IKPRASGSGMASNDYIEFLCNKPRKLGTRFYDEDYLEFEDAGSPVDYETKCCHQGGQNRKFTLNFGIPNDECEESADSQRCKNFWEFIDTEPILSTLIQDGQFVHSSHPFGIGKCSTHAVAPDINIDPVGLANSKRTQEIRERERELLQERHARTKALQLKSGQSVFENVPLCTDGVPSEEVFSYMLQDNLDAEFDSMTEYDNELKLRNLYKNSGICWEDEYVQEELPGECDTIYTIDTIDPIDPIDRRLTEEIIKRQSFVKETLDAKACRTVEKNQCRFHFRSGSSDLSGYNDDVAHVIKHKIRHVDTNAFSDDEA
ncbi:unnamed protein product, partial [Allacma fusca]